MDNESTNQDIVLKDESYVKVLYDPKRFIGKVIWSGNPTEGKYRAPFEKCLNTPSMAIK